MAPPTAKTSPRTSAKGSTTKKQRSDGFTAEERAAMKERVREIKRAKTGGDDGESEVLAKIAEMGDHDRALAQRFHEIVRAAAPELTPRTWYGMPAYSKDGKVLCYFRNASKFKTRYATFGFSDKANLDDGDLWATDFALTELGAAEEAKITALLKKAIA